MSSTAYSEDFEAYINTTYKPSETTSVEGQLVSHFGIRPTIWADKHGLLRGRFPPSTAWKNPSRQQLLQPLKTRSARSRTAAPQATPCVPLHKGRWSHSEPSSTPYPVIARACPTLTRSSSRSSAHHEPPRTPLVGRWADMYQGPPMFRKLYPQVGGKEEDPLGAMVRAGVERAAARRAQVGVRW